MRYDNTINIIIIIITNIIMLFDSLQLSGALLGNVYCVSATPRSLETTLSATSEQFQEWPYNCTLPRRSGNSSWPNQVFAPFDMLPRASITIGILMTFEAP